MSVSLMLVPRFTYFQPSYDKEEIIVMIHLVCFLAEDRGKTVRSQG